MSSITYEILEKINNNYLKTNHFQIISNSFIEFSKH
jgi:hypothetical protein